MHYTHTHMHNMQHAYRHTRTRNMHAQHPTCIHVRNATCMHNMHATHATCIHVQDAKCMQANRCPRVLLLGVGLEARWRGRVMLTLIQHPSSSTETDRQTDRLTDYERLKCTRNMHAPHAHTHTCTCIHTQHAPHAHTHTCPYITSV